MESIKWTTERSNKPIWMLKWRTKVFFSEFFFILCSDFISVLLRYSKKLCILWKIKGRASFEHVILKIDRLHLQPIINNGVSQIDFITRDIASLITSVTASNSDCQRARNKYANMRGYMPFITKLYANSRAVTECNFRKNVQNEEIYFTENIFFRNCLGGLRF